MDHRVIEKIPATGAGDMLSAPAGIVPDLDQTALLLDIDGTLLELAPTPRDVVVPPNLASTLQALHDRLDGALALVSGRSLTDIDVIFAPLQFPAVGGHGAEMRLSIENEAVASHAPPMDNDLKKRFIAISHLSPGILYEDKGYSIALHYRLAPQFERTIYEAVSAIRADLPQAPIEVLPGKFVCEIKPAGFTKATGVRELMSHAPFSGRNPIFIGDDVTDESVFAIMPAFRGVSFSVGRRAHGVDGQFRAPKDVRAWLTHLLDDEAMAAQ
ncbi:trehalose-phosphatase [Afipia broomeae ATCC 49717]|uniref:Trehalose 6-phosphate phosphatase n=2 Tax=Nitrobacteraceae TaxID=41294 RepID=K8P443_9BRAD|nr:trehalose-phosphatase [Afipia broomeae ATCC 49717]